VIEEPAAMNAPRVRDRHTAPTPPSRPHGAMNIGEAAAATGLSAKMIRHYESIGLLNPAARSDAGYRRYGEDDLRTLRFVRHARALGFGLDRIGELVSLWRDPGRASADVKRIALEHVAELDRQIGMLRRMRQALSHAVEQCHGDDRPGCPILEDLDRS
jgi:Cu(I)-responsive transcriptional regulator